MQHVAGSGTGMSICDFDCTLMMSRYHTFLIINTTTHHFPPEIPQRTLDIWFTYCRPFGSALEPPEASTTGREYASITNTETQDCRQCPKTAIVHVRPDGYCCARMCRKARHAAKGLVAFRLFTVGEPTRLSHSLCGFLFASILILLLGRRHAVFLSEDCLPCIETFHSWLVLFWCNDNTANLLAMQLLALLPALAVASLLRSHIDAEDGSARLASVPVSGTPVAIPSGASEVLE
jgi:hypothetical protein